MLNSVSNEYIKSKIAIYGNCHVRGIEICLKNSKNFNSKYELIKLPYFFEGEGPPEKDQLTTCDYFIYQEIREKNALGVEFGTKRLFDFIPRNCQCIQIPNLYELGYCFFPQNYLHLNAPHYINKNNPPYKGDERGLFVHGDYVIDSLMDMPVNDVVKLVKSLDIISKHTIIEMFDRYISKITERETEWDIKIADFIIDNYRDIQMFNDFGHPSNVVIKKMAQDLLKLLDVDDDLDNFNMIFELDEYEDPIYPCVKNVLGLNYEKSYLRQQSDKKLVEKMDFEEYVREYYYWCQRGIKQ